MAKEEKIKAVKNLASMISKYSTVCLVDMMNLPTKHIQLIKKDMGDSMLFNLSKKSVVKFALKEINKENIDKLEGHLPKQPGIILTNMPAFVFYKNISKLKYPVFAEEGDVIEKEIRIKPGPTDLLPGPAISELTKVGIIAGVEVGKIAVKKESVVARPGTVVTKDLANALRKLKITPVDIGMDIVAIFENGSVYPKDVLGLVGGYTNKIKEAFGQAMNLSVAMGYPTKENVKYLLVKAYQQAKFVESKIGGV